MNLIYINSENEYLDKYHGETIAECSIIDQQIQKLGTYEVLFPTVLPHSFV